MSTLQNHIQRLPNEVLCLVMQSLPKKSIHSCLYVCKAWYSIAVVRFYETLLLTHVGVNEIDQILLANLGVCRFYDQGVCNYAHLVKSLMIFQHQRIGVNGRLFSMAFLPRLTSLKTIDISYCLEANDYLRTLSLIAKLSTVPKLKLEQIMVSPIYDVEREFRTPVVINFSAKLYLEASLTYRDTLKYIELHDITRSFIYNKERKTPLELLDYFEQMAHLTISGCQTLESNGGIDDTLLSLVFSKYKNLESFQLINYVGAISSTNVVRRNVITNLENRDRLHLQAITYFIPVDSNIRQLLSHIRLDCLEQEIPAQIPLDKHLNLKKLTLDLPYFDSAQLRQVMKYICFPHLTTFELAVSRLSLIEWFFQVGHRNAIHFARSISMVRDLQIHFNTESFFRGPVSEFSMVRFRNNEDWASGISRLYAMLIRGSRQLKFHVTLHIRHNSRHSREYMKLHVQEGRGIIQLEETVTMTNVGIPVDFSLAFTSLAAETTHLNLIVPPSNCIEELDYAFRDFRYLSRLSIVTKSLLPGCEFESHRIICEKEGSLSKVYLERIPLSIKFVCVLTRMIPIMTTLTLADCDFFNGDWMSKKNTLDLRGFSRLESLTVSIQPITSSYTRVLIIMCHYNVFGCIGRQFYRSTEQGQGPLRFQKYDLPKEEDNQTLYIYIKVSSSFKKIQISCSDYTPVDSIL